MTESERDAYEELAGIYEFMDGHPRPDAERMARERIEQRRGNVATAKRAAPSATNGPTNDVG